jgi:hypothetical protein
MKKIILIITLMTSNFINADDGVFAINNVCATVQCFPGDNFDGFPITITEPGSYQLTSNLVSLSSNINVIEFFADNITLDLNGFSIIGPKTCTGTGNTLVCDNSSMTSDAINSIGIHNNIVVKNGSIKGFDTGIALNGIGNKIINVTVSENAEGMLNADGIIVNSIANRNFKVGFGSVHDSLVASVLVMNSSANGNNSFSAIAKVCSNVFFVDNGNGSATADSACLKYTNQSTCQTASCP